MDLVERQLDLARVFLGGNSKLGLVSYPLVSACAAVGNATQESACIPVTVGKKDHGSDGLFQWRLSRLTDLKEWAAHNFGTASAWQEAEVQAWFFQHEVATGYRSLYLDLIHGVKSVATLTANICSVYERPAEKYASLDHRIAAAEAVYKAMEKTS